MRAVKGTYKSQAIITFDLPLFIKASQIVKYQKLEVVVRFEGFHFLKSYLGCIGYIMEGSGLADQIHNRPNNQGVTIIFCLAYNDIVARHICRYHRD